MWLTTILAATSSTVVNFLIHRLAQHLLLDDSFLRDAELFGLLGDLLVDEWGAYEAGADDVGADAMLRAFFRAGAHEPDEAVFDRDIHRLQR